MKTKTLLLGVSCVDQLNDNAPDHFIVELYEDQIERIKALSSVVSSQNAYSMSLHWNSGAYATDDSVGLMAEELEIEPAELTEAMFTAAPNFAERMHCYMLTVFKNEISFSAVPKHGGDEELCTTDRVSLSELDNLEPYFALEI